MFVSSLNPYFDMSHGARDFQTTRAITYARRFPNVVGTEILETLCITI